jgi:acetylornithine/N-succinyldiaminopimelate aminotransferase
MNVLEVYSLYPFELVAASGSEAMDENGNTYLDLYGGHAVISVGHQHPSWKSALHQQLERIAYYSNSVQIPLQKQFADALEKISGVKGYDLFLCNSGTEANENALKIASFRNGRTKIVAMENAFHGRTSLAVACTDDPTLQAPVNGTHDVVFIPLNDVASAMEEIDENTCAVIVEGIQGVAGVQVPDAEYLQLLESLCKKNGALLILDEIQSGCGRTGNYFAFQDSGIQPDVITMAKGIGNGFPLAGVLVKNSIPHWKGMLGTTFGGAHLACAAGKSVAEILLHENLLPEAREKGKYVFEKLSLLPGLKAIRGKGLMIGIETKGNAALIRKQLLEQFRILTGYSSGQNTIRVLPALNVSYAHLDRFLEAMAMVLQHQDQEAAV